MLSGRGLEPLKPASDPNTATNGVESSTSAEALRMLARQALRSANGGMPRREFCQELLDGLVRAASADEVELRVNDDQRYFRAVVTRSGGFDFSLGARRFESDGETVPGPGEDSGFELLCRELVRTGSCPDARFAVGRCSCLIEIARALLKLAPLDPWGSEREARLHGDWASLLLVPFAVESGSHGVLVLRAAASGAFACLSIRDCEDLAEIVGVALSDRRAQAALRERVKELTCLYEMDRILEQPEWSMDRGLRQVVDLLPPAWLHPELAAAEIVLDGTSFRSGTFRPGKQSQTAAIDVHGARRGRVEVSYTEQLPEMDEGPFLKEERDLIESVALKVGLALERRETLEERARLEQQLRHADRLATIGQLAAGVAHELNEPLAGVLGFAELAQKTPDVPESALSDLGKIVKAALHAREVISKLMLFARQRTPMRSRLDLNALMEDGLYFLSARCQRAGIKLVRRPGPGIPEIIADQTQLFQVLVNLVVNSIQAMPGGGTLTISTAASPGWVELTVEDTGCGMTPEVLDKVFVPFFTTKPSGEGTGLGLPVVHGIVTAHGGTIGVESRLGAGSRFSVRLPANGGSPERSSRGE